MRRPKIGVNMLRKIARRIPALQWLAGLARYAAFRLRLRRANRLHAAGASALPPPMLRYRVHGALDESTYETVGRIVAITLRDCLERHGVGWQHLEVLDFACGPGRVMTQLKGLAPTCRFHGSDIDAEAIAWAREHLRDVGEFATNAALPPTEFPGERFDVIYSVSLFTHLDEAAQDAWLREMARLLRPGGFFVASVHGRLATGSCSAAELRELAEKGFAYRVGRKGRFKLDGLPEFYQTTFHTRDYVARKWGALLEIADYVEGGLAGHQDLVVMRRPP